MSKTCATEGINNSKVVQAEREPNSPNQGVQLLQIEVESTTRKYNKLVYTPTPVPERQAAVEMDDKCTVQDIRHISKYLGARAWRGKGVEKQQQRVKHLEEREYRKRKIQTYRQYCIFGQSPRPALTNSIRSNPVSTNDENNPSHSIHEGLHLATAAPRSSFLLHHRTTRTRLHRFSVLDFGIIQGGKGLLRTVPRPGAGQPISALRVTIHRDFPNRASARSPHHGNHRCSKSTAIRPRANV